MLNLIIIQQNENHNRDNTPNTPNYQKWKSEKTSSHQDREPQKLLYTLEGVSFGLWKTTGIIW